MTQNLENFLRQYFGNCKRDKDTLSCTQNLDDGDLIEIVFTHKREDVYDITIKTQTIDMDTLNDEYSRILSYLSLNPHDNFCEEDNQLVYKLKGVRLNEYDNTVPNLLVNYGYELFYLTLDASYFEERKKDDTAPQRPSN